MSAATNNLILELKDDNEDFEWYPTTREMVSKIWEFLQKHKYGSYEDGSYEVGNISEILDIGAGDGRVLKWFNELSCAEKCGYLNLFAIEKSKKLIESMDKSILTLGCDLNDTPLLDKRVDLIFCNPPYSSYKEWLLRILDEGNSKNICFIIPQRWKDDKDIARFLQLNQQIKYEIIDSCDFLNAERSARAKVDIVFFSTNRHYRHEGDALFEKFLDKQFGFDKFGSGDDTSWDLYKKEQKEREFFSDECALVESENLIEYLYNRYNAEKNEFIEALRSFSNINPKIFQCLQLEKSKLVYGVQKRLEGIRALYWDELFKKLYALSGRLTTKRASLISNHRIAKRGIEFNRDNIYAIVIWLIKNADCYIQESYEEVWDDIVSRADVKGYKSNIHFNKETFRYNKDGLKKSPHKLDYRVVLSCTAINSRYSTYRHDLAHDIGIIARNLGFNIVDRHLNQVTFESGRKEEMYFLKADYTFELLFESVSYKNGNVHIKFNKEFLAKFNIAVGKRRGWIRNKAEAMAEFGDEVSEKIIDEAYNQQLGFGIGYAKNLLGLLE